MKSDLSKQRLLAAIKLKPTYMTDLEIKKIARDKTLKATALLLTVLIALLLISETGGDFANGILFFIEAVANIHTLILLTILFGLTYFFAGRAGQEIVMEKQNIILISLKYVVLISLAISIYSMLIPLFKQGDFSLSGFENTISLYFLPLFFKMDFSLVIVWLWSTNKMKSLTA